MRCHRFWIEIVLLGSAAAVALALLLATLGAAAGAAENTGDSSQLNAPVSTSFEGMVTCSQCGAKHSAALDRSASTCVRVCVHGGSSFVLVNADTTYLLDGNLGVLKKLAGQRARVTGTLQGQTIKVVSAVSEIWRSVPGVAVEACLMRWESEDTLMSEHVQNIESHYSTLRRLFYFWPYICIGISLIGFAYIGFLVLRWSL